jgi:hypothetical protein
MRRFAGIARGLGILALVVCIAAGVAGAILGSQVQLVQRIEPHEPAMAQLLNEPGVPIGDPGEYIIFDQKAFLEGAGPGGARLISEKYLREQGIYPWQWRTVALLRNAIMFGSGISALLLGLLAWRLSRNTESNLNHRRV